MIVIVIVMRIMRRWTTIHAVLSRRRHEQLVVVLELDDYVDVEERETNGGQEYEHDVEHAHVDDVRLRHVQVALSRMRVVLDHGQERHRDAQAEQPDEHDRSSRFTLVE